VHLPTREVVPYLRAGFLCFNGNEDAFVYRTGLEDDKETTIYGLKACDVVAKFPHEWDYLDPSPNGKHWVVAAAPEGAESWEFEILDVQERSTRILTRNGHAAVFSPDSRFLVLWHTRKKKAEHTDSEDYGYDLYEIATGDRRRIPVQDVWNYQFNEDSSLFVVQGWNGMSVFEFPSCRLAWQRKSDSRTKFADKKGIILGMNRGSVEIIDARTGDTHTSKLFGFSPLNAVTFTPSQDHFVVQGLEKRSETLAAWEMLLAKWKPELFAEDRRCVIVGETASGRELCRVFQDGKCFVSADGSALAIVTQGDTGAKVITRVWDVYPDRAWRFAIGTSLSAGLALLVVHHGMCKRRRNAGKAPTAAPAIPV
jgi:hypothetical protein